METSDFTPLVITLRVIKPAEKGGKTLMEVEIVLSTGDIISKTVDASNVVQLNFSHNCKVNA